MSRITIASSFPFIKPSLRVIQQSVEASLLALQEAKAEGLELDKLISTLEAQVAEKKNLPAPEVGEALKDYCVLKKQVEISSASINAAKAENKGLREKIEDVRLENSKYKRIIKSLKEDIRNSKELMQSRSQSRLREISATDMNKAKVQDVLNKSATDNKSFLIKADKLTSILKDEQKEQIIALKVHSEFMSQKVKQPLQSIDYHKTSMHLKRIAIENVIGMKKRLSAYQKHISALKAAFSRIDESNQNYFSAAEAIIDSETKLSDANMRLLTLNAEICQLELFNKSFLTSLPPSVLDISTASTIHSKLLTEIRHIKRNIDVLTCKIKIINSQIGRVDRKLSSSLEQCEKIPNMKEPLFDPSKSTEIEEKLSLLEQAVHHMHMFKAFLKPRPSSFGSFNSDLMQPNGLALDLTSLKGLLAETSISRPVSKTSRPLSVLTLQQRAKAILHSIESNTQRDLLRAASPAPSLINI